MWKTLGVLEALIRLFLPFRSTEGQNPRKYIGLSCAKYYFLFFTVNGYLCLFLLTALHFCHFEILFSAVTSGLFFFIFIFLLLPGLSLCNLNLCLFCSHPLFRNDISLYLHPTFNFRSLSIRDLFFTISVFKNFQKANRFKLSNLKRSHKLQVKVC